MKLEDMGYIVVMVREGDAYRSKEERVEAAHKVRAGALCQHSSKYMGGRGGKGK